MLTVNSFLKDRQIITGVNVPESPLVSIILALNSEIDTLPQSAIANVLAQSFADFELLVIDDGLSSLVSDALADLLQDARCTYIRHKRHCDLLALRLNEAFTLARGKYVITISSETIWYMQALALLVEQAEQVNGSTLIIGKTIDRDTERIFPMVTINVASMLENNYLTADTVLIPRQLFDQFGMYDCHIGMRVSYEWDWWLRLVKHIPFVVLNEVIAERIDTTETPEPVIENVPLFRYLHAVPRNQFLRPASWGEYIIDALQIGDFPFQPEFARQLEEEYLRPYRKSHALEPTQFNEHYPAPIRDVMLIADYYETTLDVCLEHYTALTLQRQTYRSHLQLLDQVVPDWTQQTDGVLLVRSVGKRGVELVKEALQSSIPVGYYMDDDLINVHEWNRQVFKDLRLDSPAYTYLCQILEQVDTVWATTDSIAESARTLQRRVIPHPNSIPADSIPAEVRQRIPQQMLKIGYVGGSYRIEEFRYLWNAFQRIADEFSGQVEFEFWGLDKLPSPPLNAPVKLVSFTSNYFEYLSRLQVAQFDILLSPLLGVPRARLGKSLIKYYETAVAGALGIFSDVPPYQALVDHITCLKAKNTAESWYQALRHALTMSAFQFDQLRAACLNDVRLHYTNTAQVDLHEVAWRATEFHGITRGARYMDGQPRILYILDIPALPLLRLIRRYAIEPIALVWDVREADTLVAEGIQVIVAERHAEDNIDFWLALLKMVKPAIVHIVASFCSVQAACQRLDIPYICKSLSQITDTPYQLNALLKEYVSALPTPVSSIFSGTPLPGHPVCIVGMHRSGTSMITRLLNICGVYLGSSEDLSVETGGVDNREGLWEHMPLRDINEQLLSLMGGTWSTPPEFVPGWSRKPRFNDLRESAKEHLASLSRECLWGWKDPRTCLTIEFWQDIVSDMKVVLCLRHPSEVAASLAKRLTYGPYGTSFEQGLTLWSQYHETLFATLRPDQVLISHYESYFYDPESELNRLVEFLGLKVSSGKIRQATRAIFASLKHQDATRFYQVLPQQTQLLYSLLAEKAGPIFTALPQSSALPKYATFIEKVTSDPHLSKLQWLRQRMLVASRAASNWNSSEHRVLLNELVFPHNSLRLRAYFLTISAFSLVRHKGVGVAFLSIIRWLGGKRHSHKRNSSTKP